MKSKKYQLKNGLKVLAIKSEKSPVVSVQVWVKTGSADESKGLEGVSHFIEHLLFKGTQKFKVGEIASIVEGSGGELNAYTSFDQTVFYITISKYFLETALDCLSQMIGFPTFDDSEIDNEREVVIEEIKKTEDSPHRKASRLLFTTAYKKHPYKVPVIGFAKNIKTLSREKIVKYYENHYTTKNMTLMMVGDLDLAESKRLATKYFGPIKEHKHKKVSRKNEPKQVSPRTKVSTSSFEDSILYLAWPIPSVKHKDIPALDVLSMILGQGDSSRLMRALRIEQNHAKYAVASTFTPKDKGLFVVTAGLILEKLPQALSEIKNQIIEIIESPPNWNELNKIVFNFESDDVYSMETVDGLARKFGSYEDLFEDYKYHQEYLKKIEQLTPKQISKVAKKYLTPQSLNCTALVSSEDPAIKKEIAKFKRGYEKSWKKAKVVNESETNSNKKKKARGSLKVAPAKEAFEKFKLSTGTEVVFHTNKDVPVVCLKSAFLGGVRLEDPSHRGANELLSRTWVSNTKKMNEKDLFEKIDGLASSISAFAGRNTVGLGMTSTKAVAEDVYSIYEDVLSEFILTDEVLEREKYHVLEEIKTRADSPAQSAIRHFQEKLFGTHPYSVDPLGTKESIAKMTSADIYSHLNAMKCSRNMKMVVVGDVNIDMWLMRLEQMTKTLEKGTKVGKKFVFTPPKEKTRVFETSNKEQSHIVYGYPGLTFHSPQRTTLTVLQAILAGQGGRLFLELRDKESLAYTVSPLKMEGIDAGYFGAYIACSPEKSEKSIALIEKEFMKLCQDYVSDSELERSKKYLIGRHDIELQRSNSLAASILFDDIYDLPYEDTFSFADRVNSVTAEEIMKLASQMFSQEAVISVVGKQRPW